MLNFQGDYTAFLQTKIINDENIKIHAFFILNACFFVRCKNACSLSSHFRLSVFWSSDLSKSFSSLGLVNLFDPTKSELRGIGPYDTISIDEVSHYAQLKIDDESGNEEPEIGESEKKGEFNLVCNYGH